MRSGWKKHIVKLVAVMFLAVLFLLLLMPAEGQRSFRLTSYLHDWCHFPVFATINVLIYLVLRPLCRGRFTALVGAAAVSGMFALLVEWGQPYFGRMASVHDFLLGLGGMAMVILLILAGQARRRSQKALLLTWAAVLVMISLAPAALILWDMAVSVRQFPVLSSFDTSADLRRWEFRNVQVELTEERAGSGRALRMQITADGRYAGAFLREMRQDWSVMQALCIDLYWSGDVDRRFTVRIDDQDDYPPLSDRFQREFVLKPGSNRICLTRNELITNGSGRLLAIDSIDRLALYFPLAFAGDVLIIDDIRLLPREEDLHRGIR
jgi:hypothetical protein